MYNLPNQIKYQKSYHDKMTQFLINRTKHCTIMNARNPLNYVSLFMETDL